MCMRNVESERATWETVRAELTADAIAAEAERDEARAKYSRESAAWAKWRNWFKGRVHASFVGVRKKLKAQGARIDELRAERDDALTRLDEARKERDRYERSLRVSQQVVADQRAELATLRTRCERLEAVVTAARDFYGSTSWGDVDQRLGVVAERRFCDLEDALAVLDAAEAKP